jgi:asparagine synthase (glutamine-hydrolysing)
MPICGIAVTEQGQPIDSQTVDAMTSALMMQVGQDRKLITEPEMGFGATSAKDAASIWSSPQLIVTSDADLYNQEELRARVKLSPNEGNLSCLLGQLYLEYGEEFLAKLRGVFAVSIFDRRSRLLILATDRFGVKPLSYNATPTTVVFASQPRGILASGRVKKGVNAIALVNYLNFTVVPAPLSAFEGIAKLSPATYLVWKEGNTHIRHYWDMKYPEDAEGTTKHLAAELLERMEETVRVTSSDVPLPRLGCFLSGGTDSSSVVGLLTRVKKGPVASLSIGFAEERFNELEYAELAAKHFGSQLVVSRLGPEDAFRILPKIVALYDEPFANSSVIPTYHCQMLARERGIEVMLAGDGGDELFGGNERYQTQQVYELYKKIPGLLRRSLVEPIASQFPLSSPGIGSKLRRYIQTSNTPNPERYFRWNMLQHFPPQTILGSALPFGNGHSDLLSIPRAHYHAAPANAEMNRLLYIDVKMTLGDNDLPKVMRAAELAGINVRFPYMDHSLAEFSGRIPANLKVKGLEKRYLFKQATRDLLPKAILQKKKHGFGLPIGMWLKTDPKMRGMAEEVLRDPRTYQRGYFQRDFIEKTFASMDQDNTPYHGDILWPFLMLELWHRHHIEGNVT